MSVRRAALLGALCGLAWAAALRAVMAEVAQPSHVAWVGTFGGVLVPGVAVGALLAVAWARGAAGRTDHIARFALAPLAFLLIPGFGQFAFAALAIASGYGLGGRGRAWLVWAGRVTAISFVVALAVSVPLAGGPRLALTEPRGVWVTALAVSLVLLLVLAEAIPFRLAAAARGVEPTKDSASTTAAARQSR